MIKNVFAFVAIILAFVAYIPYLRDIIKGKTHPHVYSWFVWGFLGLIVFAMQIEGGAGPGAYITLSASLISVAIVVLGLKKGEKDITLIDTLFLISALVATMLWLIANQPTLSLTLLIIIELLGFFPTVRKSWNKPQQETLFTWALNGFRYCLSIIALRNYNTLTLLYPAVWVVCNLLFALMLVVRRQQVASSKTSER